MTKRKNDNNDKKGYPTSWYFQKQLDIDRDKLKEWSKMLGEIPKEDEKMPYALDLNKRISSLKKKIDDRQKQFSKM